MKIVHLTLAGLLAGAITSGCGGGHPANPPLGGKRIAVVEFTTAGSAGRYDGARDVLGLALAEELAGNLRRRGYQAEAFPASAVPQGDAIVRGRITRIDGGNRALRYLIGFGAGSTDLAVDGDVKRSDGQVIGNFWDERRAGFGIFGGSDEGLLQRCMKRVGNELADQIDTGKYTGSPSAN